MDSGLRIVTAVLAILVLGMAGAFYFGLQWRERAGSPSSDDFEIVQLTTSGNASRAAVSPDGKYVAYVQRDATEFSVWIRQIATASNVQIVPSEKGVEIQGVTVTPDSAYVDFVRRQGDTLDVCRVPFLGGTPRRLIERVASPIGWSEHGTRLAFVRELTPGTEALTMPPAPSRAPISYGPRRVP